MQASLSNDEYQHWLAFDRIEPIGVEREDLLHARVAQMVRSVHLTEEGQEYNTLDTLMVFNKFGQDDEDEADYEYSVQESVENVKAFFSAMKM